MSEKRWGGKYRIERETSRSGAERFYAYKRKFWIGSLIGIPGWQNEYLFVKTLEELEACLDERYGEEVVQCEVVAE